MNKKRIEKMNRRIIVDNRIISNYINYNEHNLPEELKSKFEKPVYIISFNDCKKEVYSILMKNRLNPPDWIEFHNSSGKIYTCIYFFMGAYIVQINYSPAPKIKNFDPKKYIDTFSWYENYLLNKEDKYFFSITEVCQIISDISRINKLTLLD